MPHILSDIYRRAYEPASVACGPSSPYRKQLSALELLETAFRSKLTPELTEEYERLRKAQHSLSFLECESDFAEGFRLGVRLMVAALGEEE